MKPLFLAFALATTGLAVFSAGAQDFSWSANTALTPQQILNEMVASSKYRPRQVATLEGFEMPLVLDGKESGSVLVKAGTSLNLVDVKPDGVVVEIHGNQTKLPIEKTDLIARYADRKREVDLQFEKERQDLIVAGQEAIVLPAPVAEPVAPVTQIVYVDNSQRKVNYGNYWPYTGYYPYASSYVLPYYYPAQVCYPTGFFSGRPTALAHVPAPAPAPVARPVAPPVVHPFAPARGF